MPGPTAESPKSRRVERRSELIKWSLRIFVILVVFAAGFLFASGSFRQKALSQNIAKYFTVDYYRELIGGFGEKGNKKKTGDAAGKADDVRKNHDRISDEDKKKLDKILEKNL